MRMGPGAVLICARDSDGKVRPCVSDGSDHGLTVSGPSLAGCTLVTVDEFNLRTGSLIKAWETNPLTRFYRSFNVFCDTASRDGVWIGPTDDCDARFLEPGQAWYHDVPMGYKVDFNNWYVHSAFTAVTTASRARSSGTATIKTGSDHGLVTGDVVAVSGLEGTGYNNESRLVTVVDGTTFTYMSAGDDEAETPDTGGSVSRTQIIKVIYS